MDTTGLRPAGRHCQLRDLGLMEYEAAYRIQQESVMRVMEGGCPVLLLCEHPAVMTLGRMAKAENILSRQAAAEKGIRIIPIDRGGDVTLHAPGQLVVYPILNLARDGRDLRLYMHKLEQVTIDLLKTFGIVANRNFGKTGVFAGSEKIASLGIGVRKWVTFHGLAVNVRTDLRLFELIKPCGLDVRMTSIAKLKGEPVDMETVQERLIDCFCREFKLSAAVRTPAGIF